MQQYYPFTNQICVDEDMSHDFFDPTPEQQNVVLIDAATVHKRSG
jgi:hypothetical protein